MFYYCNDLEEVIIGSLDTSLVTNMARMFQNTKITSLDLSGINTNNVINMDSMFESCNYLKYLNLRYWHFSKLVNAERMFFRCKDSLVFIDIFSLKDKDTFDFKIFDFIHEPNKKKLIFCINKTEAPNLFQNLTSKGFILNCSYLYSEKNDMEEEKQLTYIEASENTNKISKFDYSSEDIFNGQCEEINTNKILSIEDKDRR
jgi:surface protein